MNAGRPKTYARSRWGREVETRRALGTSALTMDERIKLILGPPKPSKVRRLPAAMRPCSKCGEKQRLPWASRCEPCWNEKLAKHAAYKRERREKKAAVGKRWEGFSGAIQA